ncbi:MAG: hypothetical protein QM650_18355 [Microlunatus sp.]
MSSPATTEPSRDAVPVSQAVGVVVAAVVAALAVIGLAISLTTDRLPTGPAFDPPTPQAPGLDYSAETRRARLGPVSVTMPNDPYRCPRSPQPVGSLLTDGIVCNASVHPDYRGTDDWSATAGFGLPAAALTKSTGADTAQAVFDSMRTAFFVDLETTVKNRTADTATLGGRQVAVLSGEVHYRVAGLPSRYDRIVVIALPLDDESYAIYFSSRPNDTPKSTLNVLDDSIGAIGY